MKKTAQENIPSEWLAEYDTGIYRDPPKKLVPISWKRIEARDRKLFTLDRQLAEVKKFAEKLLKDPDVKKGIAHNWKRRMDYARQALAYVKLVRERREQGDWEKVAIYSYYVGRYYEALRVLRIEHNAARGRKTLHAAWLGGHGRATDPQTVADWLARTDVLRKEDPSISDLKVAQIISFKIGGNVETIRKKIRRTH